VEVVERGWEEMGWEAEMEMAAKVKVVGMEMAGLGRAVVRAGLPTEQKSWCHIQVGCSMWEDP